MEERLVYTSHGSRCWVYACGTTRVSPQMYSAYLGIHAHMHTNVHTCSSEKEGREREQKFSFSAFFALLNSCKKPQEVSKLTSQNPGKDGDGWGLQITLQQPETEGDTGQADTCPGRSRAWGPVFQAAQPGDPTPAARRPQIRNIRMGSPSHLTSHPGGDRGENILSLLEDQALKTKPPGPSEEWNQLLPSRCLRSDPSGKARRKAKCRQEVEWGGGTLSEGTKKEQDLEQSALVHKDDPLPLGPLGVHGFSLVSFGLPRNILCHCKDLQRTAKESGRGTQSHRCPLQ